MHRAIATFLLVAGLAAGLPGCTTLGSGPRDASPAGGSGGGVTVFGDVDASVTRNR